MNEQLTARQLAEWEAYNRLDPIGEERADFRMAVLASTIMNIGLAFGSGEKGKPKPKLTTIEDFMPDWDKKDKQENIEDVSEKVRNVFMGMIPTKRKRKK